MCHPYAADPPIARMAGAAVDSSDVTLISEDGTRFAAFLARAATPRGAGVVVLPDVRGLFRFYEELALRFAEEGTTAIAVDYFGRTAGVGTRDEAFPFMHIRADVAAAVAHVRSPDGGACASVFTVGFCFGGSNSWLQAAGGHGLSGAVGFYGRPGPGRDGSPGPLQRASEFQCPVLALMGGADQGIPADQVDEFKNALRSAGIEHEVIVYPGAPHSFFDRSYEQHADVAADAWRRVLKFIRNYSRAA